MVQMHTSLLAGTDTTTTPWSITPTSLPLPRAISLMLWRVSSLPASLCLRLKKHRLKVVWSNSLYPSIFPGMEGDTCLRSADCSEGLCCARHFWSRICKPVLTEGQVCTRHRRKGTHGLELFQRCDCGEGMTCRPERGERDHTVSRTAARNLHTCQRRWHKHAVRDRTTHKHKTHTPNKPNKPVTNTDTFQPFIHLRCWQTCRHTTPNTFFPAKVADADSARKDEPRFMENWYTQRNASLRYRLLDSPINRWGVGSLGRDFTPSEIDWCCQ